MMILPHGSLHIPRWRHCSEFWLELWHFVYIEAEDTVHRNNFPLEVMWESDLHGLPQSLCLTAEKTSSCLKTQRTWAVINISYIINMNLILLLLLRWIHTDCAFAHNNIVRLIEIKTELCDEFFDEHRLHPFKERNSSDCGLTIM